MPTVNFVKECPVYDSFRVQQISGMFDVPIEEKAIVSISGDIPDDADWKIGAIVGPSGSGKSLLARKVFRDYLYRDQKWPQNKAVIDCFGDHSIKTVTHILTAVGFSSPPSWVKPYRVLSNGEQFRCQLVRCFLSDSPLACFDEYTSVVDRQVAKVCSAAVSSSIRKGLIDKQFVAVTCHYDILDWLEVDWWLDMATGQLTRRRLRRPKLELHVRKSERQQWQLFSRHHYLNANLGPTTACYSGTLDDELTCFASISPFRGRSNGKIRTINRVVVLPDYQGVGIGSRFVDTVAELTKETDQCRVRIRTSHPGFLRHLQRSARWRIDIVSKCGSQGNRKSTKKADQRMSMKRRSFGRSVVSAEFLR